MKTDAGAPPNLDPSSSHPRATLARRLAVTFSVALACLFTAQATRAQLTDTPSGELTPLQHEIKVQTARLSSADAEERRDAVTRLGAMTRPESSRAAAAALGDPSAIVRATTARAVLSLSPGEAATLILPLLSDRDEFVRREAAYALGLTRNPSSLRALAVAVETDKQPSVRGAAAVALGQIGDAGAVPALIGALSRRVQGSGLFDRVRRRKVEEDDFVRRSAAISLGQIGSREAVPVLIETLSSERTSADVRREAARALGRIGDPSAVPALRAALTSSDPYLSRLAFEILKRLDPTAATRPAAGKL
jgi:HEAT repeat protein